jgi:serine/threonine protein kinase/serine/threonine protein phosphatase PrpC
VRTRAYLFEMRQSFKPDPGDASVHSGTITNSHKTDINDNERGNNKLIWAVRTIVKKGEDRFLMCEDVSTLFTEATSGPCRRGQLCSVFSVFDGHVDSTASKFCEERFLEHLVLSVEEQTVARSDLSIHGSVRAGKKMLNELVGDKNSTKSSSSCVYDLESVLCDAVSALENAYMDSNVSEGGCFGCLRTKEKPKGGTTLCSVVVQRGVNDDDDDDSSCSFYIVCANVGDSSCLMLPHPNEENHNDVRYQRLAREHTPDDPLEAQRLVSAGFRLARMSKNGKEAGPLRMYPGGFAVSRAIGNFSRKDAIISEPECTRVKLPQTGARVLVASDGVFAALTDLEIAEVSSKHGAASECVDAVIEKVLAKRGRHDDITCIVCDIPKPETYLKALKSRTNEDFKVFTRVSAPKGLLKSALQSIREKEDAIPEYVEGDVTVHEGNQFNELNEKKIFEDYEFGDLLGRGVYGSVRLAKPKKQRNSKEGEENKNDDDQEEVAIKSVVNSTDMSHQIRNEIETLRVLSNKHPNLPTLKAVYEDKSQKLFGGGIVYLVTDVCRGSSLFDAISKRGKFDERDWRLVATQLLSAVSFMHMLGVVHRDIKPDNIMCKFDWTKDTEPHLQVIDFGEATFCNKNQKLRGYHGTKFFSSPEMCNITVYNEKTDNWSIGVVMIVLLTGFPEGEKVQETWKNLLIGVLPETLYKTTPSDRFIELIKMCLTIDYEKRPSCAKILKACEKWLHDDDLVTQTNEGNVAAKIGKSVLAAEYEKHVANLLSVCCSAKQLANIMQNVKIIQKTKSCRDSSNDTGSNDKTSTSSLYHNAWILGADLEDAARHCDVPDIAMQLESLRHLHSSSGSSSLTIDLEKLRDIETLHRRHEHVYKAIQSSVSNEAKIKEFTEMKEARTVVQSTVHGEMLYAMLVKGNLNHNNNNDDNSVKSSLDGSKHGDKGNWVGEKLQRDVSVRLRKSYEEI